MEVNLDETGFRSIKPWCLEASLESTLHDHLPLSTALDFELKLTSQHNPYAFGFNAEAGLKLPDLDTFQYGGLDNLPKLDDSVGTSEEGNIGKDAGDDRDVWALVIDEKPLRDDVLLRTWESFQQPGREELPSAYLSEAGPESFSVAIRLKQSPVDLPETISLIRNNVLFQSIFALGLGRSSALFSYDTKSKAFIRSFPDDYAICGLTARLSESFIGNLMTHGRLFRLLRDYADHVYASGNAFAAKIALARAVGTVLDAVEQHLATSFEIGGSLLQLQDLFALPSKMTSALFHAVKMTRNARTNEELADNIFQYCQELDHESGWLRHMMQPILARVARPVLVFAERWTGLSDDNESLLDNDTETSGAFVERNEDFLQARDSDGDVVDQVQYIFHPERLPSFISKEDGQTLFNIGRDIRVLREHHPKHPLSLVHRSPNLTISLDWQFSWQDANKVAEKAKEFEAALAYAVKQFQTNTKGQVETYEHGNCRPFQATGMSDDHAPFTFLGDKVFEIHQNDQDPLIDGFQHTVTKILSMELFDCGTLDLSPPLSVASTLSFSPVLAAQQRIVNAVVLRHFLRSHHLRMHLDLQRSYHLFGDGVFVSRLSAALFDPDQSSTERRRGIMRSGTGMGLRLGARGTWPPASSELRLALMGILYDCFHTYFASGGQETQMSDRDLPGGLSFAIRQLSEEEVEQTMHIDSLQALDFLRLQYSPPSPLGTILSAASLKRYDVIFKFLLRLVRLMFVVSRLPRSAASEAAALFGVQAEHFVTTCCRYFFDTGISQTWQAFTQYLDELEGRLLHEDQCGELGTEVSEGIEDICKQHEICLDAMTHSLLLRNRQQKVMQVLEHAFTAILDLSKLCREASHTGAYDVSRIEELHKGFQRNVKLFIDICKGLVGKRQHAKSGTVSREENTIERLIVMLDYNGFYGR